MQIFPLKSPGLQMPSCRISRENRCRFRAGLPGSESAECGIFRTAFPRDGADGAFPSAHFIKDRCAISLFKAAPVFELFTDLR